LPGPVDVTPEKVSGEGGCKTHAVALARPSGVEPRRPAPRRGAGRHVAVAPVAGWLKHATAVAPDLDRTPRDTPRRDRGAGGANS
jgi:hypothetical protein